MVNHGIRGIAFGAAALVFSSLLGCQPAAQSNNRMRMTAPPRTTSMERPVRTADPVKSRPQQTESPVVAPEPAAKPFDADSTEDRHPSRWPKKLRAKFAMLID